jgi:hypothetical protein
VSLAAPPQPAAQLAAPCPLASYWIDWLSYSVPVDPCCAGVWALYRNREDELLGEPTGAAAAPHLVTPATPASPKGGLELAMQQRDAISSLDDRETPVLPPAVTNGSGVSVKGTARADDAV